MTCEEFETMGLDAGRDASLSEAQRAAVVEHAASCSRCAALQESWQAARLALRSLAEETASAKAPARVEMRLRQEFRTQHHTFKSHRRALVAAWALATAAVLVGTISWIEWRSNHHDGTLNHSNVSQATGNGPANANHGVSNQKSTEQNSLNSPTLVADNELNGFTLLPGVLPIDTDDAAILRVRLQRGALGVLGLPVNEDRAAEWIQVDLLVGSDGMPQAVRLPESQ